MVVSVWVWNKFNGSELFSLIIDDVGPSGHELQFALPMYQPDHDTICLPAKRKPFFYLLNK